MSTILLKRSLVPTTTPTTSSLQIGELAINTNDGILFLRQSGSFGDKIILASHLLQQQVLPQVMLF